MRLRRRGSADPEDRQPVQEFWQWWAAAGQASAEAGIGGAGFDSFTGEMTVRGKAIHPNLAWKLAPGTQAEHALILTAAGVPEQRRDAERWHWHAPTISAVWEYHPARQASPASLESVLEIGGQHLNRADLMFDLHIDNDREVVDSIVFHPAFAKMSAEARGQVGFLALDWALAEDGVSRWIGRYDTSADRPVLEDTVSQRLQERALLVAHETTLGTRTLHLYDDSDDLVALTMSGPRLRDGRVRQRPSDHDPGWRDPAPHRMIFSACPGGRPRGRYRPGWRRAQRR